MQLGELAHIDAVRVPGERSIYGDDLLVGRSTVQIGRKEVGKGFTANDKEIHQGWDQAIASSYDLISGGAQRMRDVVNIHRVAILPVVVVPDGTLWAVDYGTGGMRLAPEQVNEVAYSLDYRPKKAGQAFRFKLSRLHFVTVSGLLKLLNKVTLDAPFRSRLFGY